MKGLEMSKKLFVFLVIGTLAMGIPINTVSRKYQIKWWKALCITVLLTVVGTLGTRLMFYIENHATGGLSFYGAVFLVPVVFLMVASVFRISYGRTMDLCAIGECIMLAMMKVHCIISGCCAGRVLRITDTGSAILFPSREIELITALIIFAVLLRWARKEKKIGQLYAWYMLLYGSTRFVLNIFREEWAAKDVLLPYGNIWSILSVLISIAWLGVESRKLNSLSDKGT